MPYLSWREGDLLKRFHLEAACVLGREPGEADVPFPMEASVSKRHAALSRLGDQWWVRDLDSKNGTYLNGLPVSMPHGSALMDGDELQLGSFSLMYTEGFPGLESDAFAERVGDLAQEIRPEPAQTLVLIRGLQLLQRSTEALLQEGTSAGLLRNLLDETLKLFKGDRGFVVLEGSGQEEDWKTVHRVGDVSERVGLSRSVLSYVVHHRTSVLSNAPMADPRFGGLSLAELHRGALMCVPIQIDGQVRGLVYLDRLLEGRPFTRFDLALFQAFVRQGAVAYRYTLIAQKALGQAEVQGELLRLRNLNERITERSGEIFAAMDSCLRWLQSYGEHCPGEQGEILRHQVARLQYLVNAGGEEVRLELPRETPGSSSLETLQAFLEPSWRALLHARGAQLSLDSVPPGVVWMAGTLAPQSVMGLVEPMFLQVGEGQAIHGRWEEESGTWMLRLAFPAGVHGPVPDPWTSDSLWKTGILWRWSEQTLSLSFPRGLESVPEEPALPLLGLVTEELELMGLFQSVAEAGQLGLFPLEEDPPLPPLPHFRYVVIDAKGVQDPSRCLQAYRRHPNFAVTPILVVRAPEDLAPTLVASGATDWLSEGFRWETLHHRLQVLKGHDELQRKALAAERLESFRRMAGTLKHEVNNPLAIISMQVELLQRRYPEETKLAKISEMVERIRGLVQVLQKMREMPEEGYPDGSSILKLS